jgi:hypothetical protein
MNLESYAAYEQDIVLGLGQGCWLLNTVRHLSNCTASLLFKGEYLFNEGAL